MAAVAAGHDLLAAAAAETDFAEAEIAGFDSELAAAADFVGAAAVVAEIAAVAAEASYYPARPKARYHSYFAAGGSVAKVVLALILLKRIGSADKLLVAVASADFALKAEQLPMQSMASADLLLKLILVETAVAAVAGLAERMLPAAVAAAAAADPVLEPKLGAVGFPRLDSVLQVTVAGLDYQGCRCHSAAGIFGPASVLFAQADRLGSCFVGPGPGFCLLLVEADSAAGLVVADAVGFGPG